MSTRKPQHWLMLVAVGVVALLAGAQPAASDATRDRSAPPTAEREAAPTDPLRARLDEIDERLGAIEQVRARFRQTRTIPMLRRPMESSGTVLMRGGAIRWDTLKPAPSTMLVREGEIQLYYPESAILEVYSTGELAGAPAGEGLPVQAQGGASPRLSQLRDRFDVVEIPASSFENAPGGEMLGLELTPIDEQTASTVKRVRVLIDVTVPMVRRVQITNAEGELTEIELFEVRLDRPVSEAEMTIRVPEGTLISRPMEGDLEDSGEAGGAAGGAGDGAGDSP